MVYVDALQASALGLYQRRIVVVRDSDPSTVGDGASTMEILPQVASLREVFKEIDTDQTDSVTWTKEWSRSGTPSPARQFCRHEVYGTAILTNQARGGEWGGVHVYRHVRHGQSQTARRVWVSESAGSGAFGELRSFLRSIASRAHGVRRGVGEEP